MWGGMVGVYVAFGMLITSVPPMIDIVRSDLGAGRAAMGLVLSAWTTLYIVTAPFAGRIVDRIGVRSGLIIGGLGVAASTAARALAGNITGFWFAVAILGITGPLVSAAAPTLCAQWFEDGPERDRAVSMYNLGPGGGAIVTLAATNTVLLPWLGTWRRVLWFESAVALGLVAVFALIAWRAPRLEPRPTRQPTPMRTEWQRLFADAGVRKTLLMGSLIFYVGHSLNNWGVDGLSDRAQITDAAAGNWLAAIGLIGMALLFSMNALIKGRGRSGGLSALLAVTIIGLIGLALGWGVLTYVALAMMSVRSLFVPLLIITLMAAPAVAPDNTGAANGLWFATAQIGAVIGPTVTGFIADTEVGFLGAFGSLAVVAAVALAINMRSPRSANMQV